MATQDIRLERIEREYGSLRQAQNRDSLRESRDSLMESRDLLMESREILMENREMLLAIIKHLEVPYEKPPMGFKKE